MCSPGVTYKFTCKLTLNSHAKKFPNLKSKLSYYKYLLEADHYPMRATPLYFACMSQNESNFYP